MKILVSGGRTGGHLIPGIAVYEELKKRGIECRYVMSTFDLNFPITSKIDAGDRILLDIKNISRKLSLRTPLYIFKILLAFLRVFRIIKDFNPDRIFITGGYISNPVALSSIILRKPLYVAEQNSVAGITNRFYSVFAKKIFTAFPYTKKIPVEKSILTGNPSIFKVKIDKTEAKRFFSLEQYKLIVGITGGSQGALKINNAVLEALPYFFENGIGLIWSAGSVDYKRMDEAGKIKEINERFLNVRLYRFIEKMNLFFSSIDLVISRAGATSISEFIHFEVPAILIPIKNSPDNHQYLNAGLLSDNGAGRILEEDSLTKVCFIEFIEEMIKNIDQYKYKINLLKLKHFLNSPEKLISDQLSAVSS